MKRKYSKQKIKNNNSKQKKVVMFLFVKLVKFA